MIHGDWCILSQGSIPMTHNSVLRCLTAFLVFSTLLLVVEGVDQTERHPNDGWFNNLQHPDWGAIDTILIRKSQPAYSDGSYKPSGTSRPNPLDISTVAFKGNDDLGSLRSRNALLVFFGQQLVEEIVDAQRPGCPREYFNIKVPKDHPYNPHKYDDLHMPFLRSRYDQRTGFSPNNPRQQLNEITPYIDGNLFYGAGKAWEDALRSFKDGLLLATTDDVKEAFPVENDIKLPFANPPIPRESDDDLRLRPVSRFRRYGNPRTHENPFLNALGVVWFRYHNYIAGRIKRRQPTWNDEQLFFAARKRVIAQYQKIVMYEWLPAWLQVDESGNVVELRKKYPYTGGQNSKYAGYEPTLHPGITVEFQSAAMRYGHTLVPARVVTQTIESNKCIVKKRTVRSKYTNNSDSKERDSKVEGVRLCNSFWVPEESLEGPIGVSDVSSVILGMVFTKAAREDHVIVSDIRENTFGPMEWSRRDLGALNIQRGRDHGVPGYNDVRKAYGLDRIEKWEDISTRPEMKAVLTKLSELHARHNISSPDDLDVFAGGLLETKANGPGDLFFNIILEQFLRIRHADRFWYENRENKNRDKLRLYEPKTFKDLLYYFFPPVASLFSDEEIAEIEATNFHDVLEKVSNRPVGDRKENTFICARSGLISLCKCHEPVADGPDVHEVCEPLQHYDYFTGSEISFVMFIVIIIAAIPGMFFVMCGVARHRRKKFAELAKENSRKNIQPAKDNQVYATEWMGTTSSGHINMREVLVEWNSIRFKIFVYSYGGQVVRMIDVRKRSRWEADRSKVSMRTSCDKGYRLLVIRVPGEIDLVLHFPTQHDCGRTVPRLEAFFKLKFWEVKHEQPIVEQKLWKEAYTADQRKSVLDKFFREILVDMKFKEGSAENRSSHLQVEEDVMMTKLTRTEFADVLGLRPHSLFVRNMFLLADTDGEGFISFDEFKNYFGILCKGTQDEKAELFFKMFDTSREGKLTKGNYKKMLKSLSEMNESKGGSNVMDFDRLVDSIFEKTGFEGQGYMCLKDFQKVFFSDETDVWKTAMLNMELNGQSMSNVPMGSIRGRMASCAASYRPYSKGSLGGQLSGVSARRHVQLASQEKEPVKGRIWTAIAGGNYWREIFWLSLYITLSVGIFVERVYYFSFEREHAGLRRITGYGVSITRGAANAQMFTFASLLVTMCRNCLTFLRETFLHRFIPFDRAHYMHKVTGWMAVIFTVVHIVGHALNFYHISTQPSTDMNCYFREFFRSSDTLASFHYWAFQTITGLTGCALTILLMVMVVFAMPYARKNAFAGFAVTHKLYYLVYALMFLHGAGRLVQEPFWAYFFLGPMVIYIFDKMVSVNRVKVELPVKVASILPSEVISLVFKRPQSFEYQSGQWVRIACPDLGKTAYHPFTLTSAPHEENLSLHIRAVGPWTNNLRSLFKRQQTACRQVQLYLDGPFGESHQDWYRFPVSVLVGGGIGITPFASILKDIAHNVKNTSRQKIPCKKVYFLWVTRTQQSFEWMTDILQEVEAADIGDFVQIHICITQMKNKFDLRTVMLYICEERFQKIAGVSMFTGLRARTHFGRPKFLPFFQSLRTEYNEEKQIGVFSCGPPAMTHSVKEACTGANKVAGPALIHHYENF